MGLTLGLLTALAMALSYIFFRKSLAEFPPAVTFFMNMLTGVVLWTPFALWTGGTLADFWTVFPYALLSVLVAEAFTVYALSKGESIITGVLFATSPAFVILFAIALLGESGTSLFWLLLVLMILGSAIVIAPTKEEFREKGLSLLHINLIAWPLIAASATAFTDVISKGIIDQTSAGSFLLAFAIIEIPVSIIFLWLQGIKPHDISTIFHSYEKYKYAFFSGLFSTLAVLFFWYAAEVTSISVTSSLANIFPVLIFILGYVFLKEKLSTKNTIGTLIVLASILLLTSAM